MCTKVIVVGQETHPAAPLHALPRIVARLAARAVMLFLAGAPAPLVGGGRVRRPVRRVAVLLFFAVEASVRGRELLRRLCHGGRGGEGARTRVIHAASDKASSSCGRSC